MPDDSTRAAQPFPGAAPQSAAARDHVPAALVLLLFACMFAALTTSSFDTEFWWHLAFGRWIAEHRALPAADPFDCTSAVFGAGGQVRYQLTQYWLAQLLLYGSYLLAGLKGTFLLRAATFTGLFALLYRLLRRVGAGRLAAVLLVALAYQVIVREFAYIENRPQMWTSLLFVALLLLLEHLREGRRWAQYALPPFMVLWANLHAGFVLGLLVIAVAVAAAFVTRNPERRRILAAAAVAAVATGANPAGFEPLYAFQFWRLSKPLGIFEEQSLFAFLKVSSLPRARPWLTAAFALPFVTLLAWPLARIRARWDLYLIFLLTLAMGLKAQRYLIFTTILAAVATALNLSALRERWRRSGRRSPLPAAAPAALTAAVVLALSFSYAREASRVSGLRPRAPLRHPLEEAADYLKGSGLRGNVFNEYASGGYLAWRLHPELKIFIYGRMAYPALLAEYDDVIMDPRKAPALTPNGGVTFLYQRVFDRHGINVVAVPAANSLSGDALTLPWMLAHDDGWAIGYAQPALVVFLRKSAVPAPLVAAARPRAEFYDSLIAIAESASRSQHGRMAPVWRRTLALAHYGKGDLAEAVRLFDDYLSRAPRDSGAREMRDAAARGITIRATRP